MNNVLSVSHLECRSNSEVMNQIDAAQNTSLNGKTYWRMLHKYVN